MKLKGLLAFVAILSLALTSCDKEEMGLGGTVGGGGLLIDGPSSLTEGTNTKPTPNNPVANFSYIDVLKSVGLTPEEVEEITIINSKDEFVMQQELTHLKDDNFLLDKSKLSSDTYRVTIYTKDGRSLQRDILVVE